MIEPIDDPSIEQALRLNQLYLALSVESRARLLQEAERLAALEARTRRG